MAESPVWPNFFIVGVAKSGTTSLSEWLKQHPQIFIPHIKEPRYFARDLVEPFVRPVIKSQEEYLRLYRRAAHYPARGDASTPYFSHWQRVPERIKAAVPEARIIILLRDPIERAYSAWLMQVRHGRERLPFEEAVKRSPFRSWYLRTYAEPVKKYLEVFGDDKVLILLTEDLRTKPYRLLREVARFLGIEEDAVANIRISVENVGGLPRGRIAKRLLLFRSRLPITMLPLPKFFKRKLRCELLKRRPPMNPQVIEYLKAIFEPDLAELETILGRRLPELRKVW